MNVLDSPKQISSQAEILSSHRKLGLWAGISTIMGLMVGSGIFSSAGIIQKHVGSSGMTLILWILTGMLALTGALCYAELGTMIPGSGGEAQYLEYGLGSWSTFIFNWTSILLLKPGTVAILSVATSAHLLMLFFSVFYPSISSNSSEANLVAVYPWTVKIIAAVCCLVVTLSASISTKVSDRIQSILTMGKILALAFVMFLGLYYACLIDRSIAVDNLRHPFSGTSSSIDDYASAFNHGLWAFEGWNNLNIIAGDLLNPHKTLPLSIWISVVTVVALYLLTIFGYFAVLPSDVIKTTETIGVQFGNAVVGRAGSIIMPIFIAASTFGSALSSMSTSSEIVIFAAQQRHIPRFFGVKNSFTGTAVNAYALQCVLAIGLVLLSGFDDLVHIYTFPQWVFYGACVVVLLKLRVQEPQLSRPYRVFLSTPILFLFSCVGLMATSFKAKPIPVGSSLLVLLIGLPGYYFFTLMTKKRSYENDSSTNSNLVMSQATN